MGYFELKEDGSQIIHYHNRLFPVHAVHTVLSKHKDGKTLTHWHTDIEMVYIRDGSMIYNVNGVSVPICKGDCIIINARQLHGCLPAKGTDCSYTLILINPSIFSACPYIMRNFIDPIVNGEAFSFLQFSSQDEEAPFFSESIERFTELYKSESIAYELEIISIAHTLMQRIYTIYKKRQLSVKRTSIDHSLRAQRHMVTFISEHYAEKLTLDEIADSGQVSSSTCLRLFRQYLNQTPFTYLTLYRLNVSCDLLLNTHDSIAAIAQACGFSQQSYFCRQFVKQYGMTPMQYRKKQEGIFLES